MTLCPTLALFASRPPVAAFLVGVGVVSACGDSPDRAKLGSYCVDNPSRQVCATYRSDDTTRAFFDAVVGTWRSNCVGFALDKNTLYIKDSFTFQKNLTFRRMRGFFADEKCTQPFFTFSHEGELRARKTTGAFDYLLDFNLLISALTAESAEGAAILGSSQSCQTSGWEKGKTTNLNSCTISFREGEVDEQKFSFQNLEHFNGMKLNVTTKTFVLGDEGKEFYVPVQESRPSKTRDDLVYTRQ
ncbi:MAG: hypothetical protein IOD12_01765 [Silvanigrellales bacterium]|nr:hypothetical protein [Silvanigrellales bacterium]